MWLFLRKHLEPEEKKPQTYSTFPTKKKSSIDTVQFAQFQTPSNLRFANTLTHYKGYGSGDGGSRG